VTAEDGDTLHEVVQTTLKILALRNTEFDQIFIFFFPPIALNVVKVYL